MEKTVEQSADKTILEVKNLKKYFPITKGFLRRKVGDVKAVDNISLKIKKGEIFSLVGESGCGKTTVGRCILRIYDPTEGEIRFQGRDIVKLPYYKIRALRREIQLIFQDPYGSLDPRQSAGSIVGEAIKIHKICDNKQDYKKRVKELFTLVGLDPAMANRFPPEFSGGQ
jgi:peptide/nickel transport system ATP-binding protein